MTTDFESYRRQRNYRRMQTKVTERPSGHTDVWEQLEAQERQEMKNELLNAEVDEFFSDATRLAATIVQRVAENHEDEISDKLRHEMEEFLCASIRHATNMVLNLDWKSQAAEQIKEPSLRNLLAKELDQFRAEGTANLADRHFGKDPFHSDLGAELSAPTTPRAPTPVEEEPGMRASAAPEPLATPKTDPETASPTASSMFKPRKNRDPHRISMDDTFAGGEISSKRIRLSDDELGVDFGGGKATDFSAGQFDARVSDKRAIQRTGSPFTSDDEEDLPLAALAAQETPAVEPDPEPFGAGVELESGVFTAVPETMPEPEPEPMMAEPVVQEPVEEPVAQAEPQSDDEIRRALLLLVEQGIMTPEQARAAYRKQTQA